jgi:hypothetical protein
MSVWAAQLKYSKSRISTVAYGTIPITVPWTVMHTHVPHLMFDGPGPVVDIVAVSQQAGHGPVPAESDLVLLLGPLRPESQLLLYQREQLAPAITRRHHSTELLYYLYRTYFRHASFVVPKPGSNVTSRTGWRSFVSGQAGFVSGLKSKDYHACPVFPGSGLASTLYNGSGSVFEMRMRIQGL